MIDRWMFELSDFWHYFLKWQIVAVWTCQEFLDELSVKIVLLDQLSQGNELEWKGKLQLTKEIPWDFYSAFSGRAGQGC